MVNTCLGVGSSTNESIQRRGTRARRTLAVALPAFRARVDVEPADRFQIDDPLLAAAFRRFGRGLGIDPPPFAMRFTTTIPRQVGLGGSSAIVVAALRALATAFDVDL